jgi:hypothetical protein
MNTLRTVFGRLNQRKDRENFSDREKDIVDLTWFLKDHMRPREKTISKKCTKKSSNFSAKKGNSSKKVLSPDLIEQEEDEIPSKCENNSESEKKSDDLHTETEVLDLETIEIQTQTENDSGLDVGQLPDFTPNVDPNPIQIESKGSDPQLRVIDSSFWEEYLAVLRNANKGEFDIHECWGRLLAEKLKFLDPLKAEELKLRIDEMVLECLKDHSLQQSFNQTFLHT